MTQIHTALIAINKEVGSIGKNQKNQSQGFKFRGVDDVFNELHSLFAKHEVIILPQVKERIREERTNAKGTVLFHSYLTIEYQFMAADGSMVCATVVGEALDSGDKSVSKAMSIAIKYCLLQLFLIPTEEMKDPDFVTHEIQGKPAISDKAFMKALERITKGEVELIIKIEETYELTPQQKVAMKECKPIPTEAVEVVTDNKLPF